jgi:lysophospholipase L1-like esterase
MRMRMSVRVLQFAVVVAAECVRVALPCFGQEAAGQTICDMDSLIFKVGTFGTDKKPTGTQELVDGKFGKATKFSFADKSSGGFFFSSPKTTPEWDKAAGISFWVKGDGSDSYGGLEMIDPNDYALRYAYCFPIDSTEWKKIVIPWRDILPETPAGEIVDPVAGYRPSQFGNLWFGKWWYWRDYPAHSFTVDQIALEPTIALDTRDYTPAVGGTPRLLAKLKAKQPVTIVTMGDSLSDKRHWANKPVMWSELLVQKLKDTYGSEVTFVNPAMGGTTLDANLILMPKWLKMTPEPDLVTIWFGFNDYDSGMRGRHFADMLRVAVNRIRRMTNGKAEVMIMTTNPAIVKWTEMEELAEACRSVAAGWKTGLADVSAAFHTAGKDDAARATLYAWDRTHLGEAGHKLAAETVAAAIAASP